MDFDRHCAEIVRTRATEPVPDDQVRRERDRRGAAVTIRGSLTELLLALYQRKDAEDVVGDLELFKLWQTHVRFG
ncbi:hypothetical protein GCM10027598_35110 [Amycolatopsis oliviviridis]|uniref:MDMPI C-terminal domain-containing protein n=1 Tax=Amycolatopsis oliviviridis TaxID=1471590 RepID=A0ABQ3MA16_9PSEU|nr:hypothetical protein [Amycolatopsis oliviviridis]GHH36789.1 hypothetical protein GCM10017790_80200 [Amycolatopsis oliviviridis]